MATQALDVDPTPNWQTLFKTHKNWLSTVVYARLRDSHAVDEVLQETALAACKQGLSGDADGVCRWLYAVAIRQSLLYRRQKFRNAKKLAGCRTHSRTGHSISTAEPLQLVVASEQQELVREAMKNLNSRDYEILMLKYSDNWSCRDMAERLGSTESAMKSRLLRARNNLRKQLLRIQDNWELK